MSEQQETAVKSCPLCGAEFEKMVCDGAALRFRCGSVFGPSMDPKQGMESDNCCRRQLRQKIKELEWLRADQETNKQLIRELHDVNQVFLAEIDRLRRERDNWKRVAEQKTDALCDVAEERARLRTERETLAAVLEAAIAVRDAFRLYDNPENWYKAIAKLARVVEDLDTNLVVALLNAEKGGGTA